MLVLGTNAAVVNITVWTSIQSVYKSSYSLTLFSAPSRFGANFCCSITTARVSFHTDGYQKVSVATVCCSINIITIQYCISLPNQVTAGPVIVPRGPAFDCLQYATYWGGNMWYTVCKYVVCSVQYAVSSIQYTVYSIQYTVSSIPYPVYSIQYPVYSIQYPV